ncbi:hypothetical protein LI328DRAFT_140316 [Trichoderma asperelloides]|nr:hypothetical protein LI328DRAFT_140316 [Trichoderma asperelloides]
MACPRPSTHTPSSIILLGITHFIFISAAGHGRRGSRRGDGQAQDRTRHSPHTPRQGPACLCLSAERFAHSPFNLWAPPVQGDVPFGARLDATLRCGLLSWCFVREADDAQRAT